jgi:hypothetical protein
MKSKIASSASKRDGQEYRDRSSLLIVAMNDSAAALSYRDGNENAPKRFAAWRDAGVFGLRKDGSAGDRDEFRGFKADNDTGNHWVFDHVGQQFHQRTFNNLNSDMLPFASSEVDNGCDSAAAHFKDLMDKTCNNCGYNPWLDTEHYNPSHICCENPCFMVNLISNDEFTVEHGGC